MNAPSDEEIMLQVRSGTLEALSVIFERYQRAVYNYYLRMTGNPSTSEDLSQSLFYKVILNRHTYKPGHPVQSWIFRIARNLFYDHCRKQRANKENLSALEELVCSDIPGEQTRATDDLRLLSALTQLSPGERELIVLHHFNKLSYQTMAALYRTSAGAVKTRTYRAVNELRKAFFDTPEFSSYELQAIPEINS